MLDRVSALPLVPASKPADDSVSERLASTTPDKNTDDSVSECSGWFAKLAQKLWPKKPSASLRFLTDLPEWQCYRLTSDEHAVEPRGTVLVTLLRGAEGGRVLDELIAGSKSKWVRDYRRAQAALPLLDQWKQLDLDIE